MTKPKELNSKQLQFCYNLAEGMNQTQAYMKAYEDSTEETARANGHKLLTNADIKLKVDELRKIHDDSRVLSLQEKREFLAGVVRTPLKGIDANSPLIQDISVTKTTNKNGEITITSKLKLVSKADAIKIDNAMMGHNTKQESLLDDILGEVYKHVLQSDDPLPIAKKVTPIKTNKSLPSPLDG